MDFEKRVCLIHWNGESKNSRLNWATVEKKILKRKDEMKIDGAKARSESMKRRIITSLIICISKSITHA